MMTEAVDKGAVSPAADPAEENKMPLSAAALALQSGGSELSAAEKAYFAGRGESGLPQEPAETAENAPEDAPRPKTVPHGALHAEREEHKKTRAELEKMRASALAWQQELAVLQQRQPLPPQPAGAAEPPPDPREDFLGFARWQGQEISRLQQALTARQQQAEEQQRHEAAEAAIMEEWERSVNEARAAAPDIDDALEFLEAARLSQLQVLAPLDRRFADKNFCERQIAAELRDIVIGTFQQGKSPAAAVYEIAKAYGYGRDEAARMGKLREAAAGARSLTAGSGKQAGDPFLLETVANMPEADFAKWYERNRESFRAMFGG